MDDGKKELLRCLSKGFSKRRHMDIAGDKSRLSGCSSSSIHGSHSMRRERGRGGGGNHKIEDDMTDAPRPQRVLVRRLYHTRWAPEIDGRHLLLFMSESRRATRGLNSRG